MTALNDSGRSSASAITTSIAQRRAAVDALRRSWTPMTISQHFDECARVWPDATVLVCGEDALTYGQLVARSKAAAAALRRAGVGTGDRVGLLMENSTEFYALKIALSRLGAVTVPLNYLFRPQELRFVCAQSRLQYVIADAVTPAGPMLDLLSFGGLHPTSRATDLPDVREVWVRGSTALGPFSEYGALDFGAGDAADAPQEPTSVTEIIYTSGSTGNPKGALISHDALLRDAHGTALCRALSEGWKTLTALPPFHMFGYLQAILATTMVGGSVVIEPKFDAARHLELVERFELNDIVCVPAMTYQMLNAMELRPRNISSMIAIFSAGNAVPEHVWHRVRAVFDVNEISTAYGMTEITGIATMVCPDDSIEILTNTVGRQKPGGSAGVATANGAMQEIRIVDPFSLAPVAPGREGELLFRGPTVTRGYWENDEDNDRSFVDGWFRSGDLGRFRDDGALVLTGRVKELYKSGGELVSPREVETVIAQVAGVAEVFVVGVPDERWGEAGCAWVVPTNGSSLDRDAILLRCRSHLAPYKVPRHVFEIAVADLPTTGSGKLLKRDLVTLAVDRLSEMSSGASAHGRSDAS